MRGAFAAALFTAGCTASVPHGTSGIAPRLAAIEAASGGRLGVAVADAGGQVLTGHRAGERFALCSTFKLLLAGMVLDGHSKGHWSLQERLPVSSQDIVFHSPAIKERLADGFVEIGEAARTTIVFGDNAAANLLLRKVGGPQAFNRWLRDIGDRSTRLDRLEPELNSNDPGDLRDTTTPEAIARSTSRLLFGSLLQPSERQMLADWLIASRTGLQRLRAGLPDGFVVGDKTGTCGAEGRESYNDVAVILPRTDAGLTGTVIAVYLDRPNGNPDQANAWIADVAEATAPLLERH